ncbi:MAG: preprotein translocase subunit YajC [Eubacteriales bacterium]|nr:preprotein translocase subunit YajC [Eubacteriales bacterium]
MEGNPLTFIIIMMAVMILPTLFMSKTQKKQQQNRQFMLDSLEKGDEVITSAGFTGVIDAVKETSFIVRFSPDDIRMEIAKEAILRKVEEEEDIPELETEYDYVIDDDADEATDNSNENLPD